MTQINELLATAESDSNANLKSWRQGHLVLVVEDELKPKMIDAKRTRQGHIKGRLLWGKRSAGTFTCAAHVEALSDEKIKAYDKNRSLQGNLEYRARQAGLKKFLRLK